MGNPTQPPGGVDDVLQRMDRELADLEATGDPLRHFLATYRRTTVAVSRAVAQGTFEDPDWVERWDVVFADLYLSALADHRAPGRAAPRPWRIAFAAPQDTPPLRQVLLGINAHVNYDLPRALLALIPDEDFDSPAVLERRRRDHERIDGVLAARVGAEDASLTATSGGKSVLDRLLQPLQRRASRRFLREAREKVWHNTLALRRARQAGPDAYRARCTELEVLSAARVHDLLAPGQVLLRLAVAGFGVVLPPD
ncbi:DUF5995 family protein [Nakamurella endophytica]|uniref:DUF5995 family protein n=1 Tax=Nakamurella endophytica TaxID=1748367 RepID=UPI001E4647A0|nr:DUF5995 family protein [Nakamurella endophytica]